MQRSPNSKQKRKYSNDSSSLDYLNKSQENEDSKMDIQISSKKRDRSWAVGQSKSENIRKVMVNNDRRQIFLQNDAIQGCFLYKPGVELPSLYQFYNQTIKVIIASEYITKDILQIAKRNIYGTDSYTSNSDLLCIAIHSGLLNIGAFNAKKYQGVEIHFKVVKSKKNFTGSIRNGIASQAVKVYNGNSLKPQSQKMLVNLPPLEILEKYASNMHIPIGKNRTRKPSRNLKTLIPIPQTHLTFNMNNEPAHKYSLINIADKGYTRSQFLVAKLDDLALYLETASQQKYEIAKILQNQYFWVYRISKLKEPYKKDNHFFKTHKVPVSEEHLEIIFKNLEWDEITWGTNSVNLKDHRIENIKSFKFYQRNKEV